MSFDFQFYKCVIFVKVAVDTTGILTIVFTTVGDGKLTVVVGVICVHNLFDNSQFKSGIFVGSRSSLDFLPNLV